MNVKYTNSLSSFVAGRPPALSKTLSNKSCTMLRMSPNKGNHRVLRNHPHPHHRTPLFIMPRSSIPADHSKIILHKERSYPARRPVPIHTPLVHKQHLLVYSESSSVNVELLVSCLLTDTTCSKNTLLCAISLSII